MSDEHAPPQTPATSDATSPRPSRVAIERVRQEDASPEAIHQAVRQALHATAAFDEAVRAGRRVFLKVNLVTNASRDEGICTDPEVVRAVIEEVLARGATPIVGDNPAVASTKSVLKSSGIGAVVESFGLEVPSLSETATLRCARAERFNAFEVSRAILDADVLINLPKLKTHSLTYMSMAMKNLFGLIPGTRKARWHVRAPHADLMATLFADLYSGVVDHFTAQGRGLIHLCDGVIALEGDGPGHGGKARFLGAILASSDGVALDRVGCSIAGLDFKRLTTLQKATRRGLGEGCLNNIEITGAAISDFAGVTLEEPAGGGMRIEGLGARLANQRWLRDLMIDHPELTADLCVGCRRCAEICPVGAITFVGEGANARPAFDKRPCIRCYCCAEVCPKGAIAKSRVPWLGRLLG